jgi:hypothetical protein
MAMKVRLKGDSAPVTSENCRTVLKLVDQLLGESDYMLADKLIRSALAIAPDAATTLEIRDRVRKLDSLRTADERISPYIQKLKASPEDTTANLEVGRYLCFIKGDWKSGSPLLAKGGKKGLSDAAALDLAGASLPEKQADVGDAWWNVSEKEAGPEKLAIEQRAAKWYADALSQGDAVVGLKRVLMEKRVASARTANGVATTVRPTGAAQWISKSATYKTSSNDLGKEPLPNLLDGRGGGYQSNGFAFHTLNQDNPYIIIDLGGSAQLSRIEIVNRRDDLLKRAKTVTMWVANSADGPWTETWHATSIEKQWNVDLDPLVTARYIKLGLTEHNIFHLYSVKIFGFAKAK